MLRRTALLLIASLLVAACSRAAKHEIADAAPPSPAIPSAASSSPEPLSEPPEGISPDVWQRAHELAKVDIGKAGSLLVPAYEEAWRTASAAFNHMDIATHRKRVAIIGPSFNGQRFRFGIAYKVDWAAQTDGEWAFLVDPQRPGKYCPPSRAFAHGLAMIPAEGKLVVRSEAEALARLAKADPTIKFGRVTRITNNVLDTESNHAISLRTGEPILSGGDLDPFR